MMKTILQKSYLKLSMLFLLLSAAGSFGQVTLPHLDAVNYTAGQPLQTQTSWALLNSGDDILVAAGNLSYSGLVPSTGNKISFAGTGIDAAKAFTPQTTGTVYYSFLVNVTALGTLNTTGSYFTGITDASTGFGATVWLRSDGAGYDIGFNPRTTVANTVWLAGTTAVNTTLLIVVSYQVVSGAANDITNIWINPTAGIAEPAPTTTITNTGGTDLTTLNRLLIRQDSNTTTPSVEMDELRVGLSWTSVTPAPAGDLNVSTNALTDFGSINIGDTSPSDSFTVDGTGLGANDIIITAPADFQVSLDDAAWFNSVNITPTAGTVTTTTVYARFAPGTAGFKSGNITVATFNAPTENISVSGTGVTSLSVDSDIIADGSFVTPANIDYTLYQATDITDLNSIEVAGFTIRDGGATAPDGDSAGTELNSISFSLSNFANLRRVALYDGVTELGEVNAAATVTFSGLTLTAADDSTQNFSLRATFVTSVTDNSQFQFVVTAASSNVAGSTFTTANAGGASSSNVATENTIEVTADHIVFVANAVTSVVNVAMTPSVTIRAQDANNNTDLDYTAAVDITSTGTLAVSPTSVNAVAGLATFSNIVHTQSGLSLQLTATSGAFTPITSALFDVFNPIFSNSITGTNPSSTNPYVLGQTFDANISVSGIGRSGAISAATANDRYSASGWNSPSYDATKYFEFTLTPNPGYEIDFVNFIYTGQASGTGPTSFSFRSSVDGYTAEIGTPVALGTQINLSGAAYQDISGAITFRIYGFGASAAGGTFSVNSFVFNGSVAASITPIITALPSSLTGLDYLLSSGPSASQSFEVDAANLFPAADDLSVSVSSDFEVSTDDITFGPTAIISYTGGTVTDIPVYVRTVAGLTVGTYNGAVTVSGGTAPDVFVDVEGIVREPFEVPYSNTFRTQALHNDALAQGFVLNSTTFNPTGYEQIALNGYVETPLIDFTQLSTYQVAFSTGTFGGNTGQTLELQISTDSGSNYTTIGTIAPPSSTFVTLKTDIDFSLYPSTTGKLRIQMTAGTNTSRFRDFYIYAISTWDGASWSNGTPDTTTIAIIDGDYHTGNDGELVAKSLTVESGNVTVASTTAVHLQDELTINGGFVSFENNANLLQVNNATNTGIITIERDALMRRQDYVYWSSPVAGQNLLAFSPETLTNRFYTMDETANTFASVDPALNSFVAGTGYSIRAPNTFPNTPQTFVGLFEGVPHNGSFTVPVTRNNQGYNLIGNPYPSPISATAFATANPTIGTLYFWTHTTQGAASGANYATFNGTGAAAPAGSEVPNGTIQVGQGFLINAPALTTNVFFNNLMRVDNQQNQFFRAAVTETTPEKNRIWLNLTNATTNFNQTLLGYVDGATNELDVQFDGKLIESQNAALYTVINEEAYVIQGKSLPFADTDQVNLGFKADMDGTFTITLDHVDGLFAGEQSVFLKDNLTGVIHNIKESAYTFASNAGTFNNRFQVVYLAAPLGIENPGLDANNIIVFKQNQTLTINSGSTVMKNVKVFDVRGQQLYVNNNVNATTSNINLNVSNQVLIVQITSEDNKTVSKKVVY